MNRYTIYCTAEQTKKALELGSPIIEPFMMDYSLSWIEIDKHEYIIPTTEQMIGWLEEQDILIDINPINGLHFYWMLRTKKLDEGSGRYMWECQYTTPERDLEYDSRKEAIIAAIDAALEYLSNEKIKH